MVHGTDVVELGLELPPRVLHKRSQHTNFGGVRGIDFNILVVRQTQIPRCAGSSAMLNRQFGAHYQAKQPDAG